MLAPALRQPVNQQGLVQLVVGFIDLSSIM
jgi:hypothetical protein